MAIRVRSKRVDIEKMRWAAKPEERATLPVKVDVPDPPMYRKTGGEKPEHDEQQVYRVELMMMKGVRNRGQLMTLLEISDARTMDGYMKRVYARWEMNGTTQEHARHRGEALSRLDLIESELWSRMGNIDTKTTPQVALNYLNAVLNVQRHRSDMLGLTPKVIAHLGIGGDADNDVTRRVAQHDRITSVLMRVHELVEERSRVIEHEPAA